jgi:hypothetical protein
LSAVRMVKGFFLPFGFPTILVPSASALHCMRSRIEGALARNVGTDSL